MLANLFLHKLFGNAPGFNVAIMAWRDTLGSKSQTLTMICENQALQWQSDSLSACRRLISVVDVLWWDRHMAYWASKCSTSVSNELIVWGESWCHHVNAGPFRLLGKTLHRMTSSLVYKLTYVMHASKCSSRYVVPLYQSLFKGFHPRGKGASSIPSAKGCRWRNLVGWLWDLWKDRPTRFVWWLVSCEEWSSVATYWVGTVCCVFACDCCNCARMTKFS